MGQQKEEMIKDLQKVGSDNMIEVINNDVFEDALNKLKDLQKVGSDKMSEQRKTIIKQLEGELKNKKSELESLNDLLSKEKTLLELEDKKVITLCVYFTMDEKELSSFEYNLNEWLNDVPIKTITKRRNFESVGEDKIKFLEE